MNWIVILALFCAAVVDCQHIPSKAGTGRPGRPLGPASTGRHRSLGRRRRPGMRQKECIYRDDQYSMFYWKDYENICTKSLCDTYPWLKCSESREYILDQAIGHYPEDILTEIDYLKKYFNTMIPRPNNILPYHCAGVCQENAKQLQLERIFTTLTMWNDLTYQNETRREMCIVIGPEIYYQQCGGNCVMPFGRRTDSYCVPDVTVRIDIWVYCPEVYPSCHKVKFDVPLSCSCKRFACKKQLPAFTAFKPNLPNKPVGWNAAFSGK